MRTTKLFTVAAIAVAMFVNGAFLNAQVTVGDDKTPEVFSLLELKSNTHNGLRLPQISSIEARDAISDAHGGEPEMMGLTIFNMETYCVETWNGSAWIAECGEMPNIIPSKPSDPLPAGRVTAYINAMYDFQKQTLTAYLSSGVATAYQWQISMDGGTTWYDIYGAKSQNYVILADFMYDYAGVDKSAATPASINVLFRCLMTNETEKGYTTTENQLDILFVRTTTAGYGEQGGVRYLTLRKGYKGSVGGTSVKMALLNVGQSDDGSNADDLGDYYQWGRVADGHEKTIWSKDATTYDVIATALNGPPVLGPLTANLDANGQIMSGTPGYGVYIDVTSSGTYVWGALTSDLWGNDDTDGGRAADPANLSEWTARGQANNPCPSGGWYIPSAYDFWDMYNGDGSDTFTYNLQGADNSGTNNTWVTHMKVGNNNNITGSELIINNSTGEILILPALAFRSNGGGVFILPNDNVNTSGYYWSSTAGKGASTHDSPEANILSFSNLQIYAGNTVSGKALGFSVRCIAQ